MTYIRTLTLLLRVNTGAPTWWAPRFRIERSGQYVHVSTGWLRCAVQVGINTQRHEETEVA